MANYKLMYSILFNKITDIICELQEIQQEVEEIYMSEKPVISIVKHKENQDKK